MSTVHCDAPQWCVDVAACLRAGGVADAAVIHTLRSGHPALGTLGARVSLPCASGRARRHRGIAGLLCAADLRGLVDVAERPGRTTPRGCGRSSSRTRSQPRLRHAPLVVAAWSPAQHSAVPPCLHRVRTTSALHRVGECIVCTNGSNGDRAHAKLATADTVERTNCGNTMQLKETVWLHFTSALKTEIF